MTGGACGATTATSISGGGDRCGFLITAVPGLVFRLTRLFGGVLLCLFFGDPPQTRLLHLLRVGKPCNELSKPIALCFMVNQRRMGKGLSCESLGMGKPIAGDPGSKPEKEELLFLVGADFGFYREKTGNGIRHD